jgi:hypothetical protein
VNVEQTPVNEDEIELVFNLGYCIYVNIHVCRAEEIAETDKLIAQAKIDKRSELKK